MAWSVTKLTGTDFDVLTGDELASHLRLNDPAENASLLAWQAAAIDLFQSSTGYVFCQGQYRLELDTLPRVVRIPRRPVVAVSAVQYRDGNGNWQPVAGWSANTATVPASVLTYDHAAYTVPTVPYDGRPVLRIDFTAGHASPTAVPQLAKQFLRLITAHYWTHREGYSDKPMNEVPAGIQSIYDRFRNPLIGGV